MVSYISVIPGFLSSKTSQEDGGCRLICPCVFVGAKHVYQAEEGSQQNVSARGGTESCH